MGFGLGDILGAGASLLGGVIGNDASGDAARAAERASQAGVAENRRQFDTVLNLQAPAINTGNAARSLLGSILGLDVAGSTYTAGLPTTDPGRTRTVRGHVINIPGRATTQPVPGGTNGGVSFTNPGSKPMDPADIMARLEAFPGYKFAVDQAVKSAGALGSATGSLGGNVSAALADRVGGGIAMPTFENYLNRLAGLSGGAQTATNNVSNGAIQTGQLVANGLQNAGDSRASGILGQAGTQIGTIGGILAGIGQGLGNQTNYSGGPAWGSTGSAFGSGGLSRWGP